MSPVLPPSRAVVSCFHFRERHGRCRSFVAVTQRGSGASVYARTGPRRGTGLCRSDHGSGRVLEEECGVSAETCAGSRIWGSRASLSPPNSASLLSGMYPPGRTANFLQNSDTSPGLTRVLGSSPAAFRCLNPLTCRSGGGGGLTHFLSPGGVGFLGDRGCPSGDRGQLGPRRSLSGRAVPSGRNSGSQHGGAERTQSRCAPGLRQNGGHSGGRCVGPRCLSPAPQEEGLCPTK